MRRSLTIAVILVATVLNCVAEKETVQQLAARAEAGRPEDRPGLYIEIAERQLKAVAELFGTGKDDEAVAAVKDVVTYSEKAHDAAIDSRNRLKATEIAFRKMAAKLRDIKRTLSFEDQAPVQAAADRLEALRTDLLSKMFGKGK
ncbi:MAG TPA: hypothetical protein VK763_15595 [Terriglobales bacterium]|jgi:hypothetical protein|nr:hypothetical protein [Terriglobales bacterium]